MDLKAEVEIKKTFKLTKEDIDTLIIKALGLEGKPHIDYDISGGIDPYDDRNYLPHKLHGAKIVSTTFATS